MSDPTYESCIQWTIQGLASGQYKNITVAAKAQTVSRQTLTQRSLTQSHIKLENVKKKKNPWQLAKLCAHFITLPELKEDFEKAEVERCEKEKVEAEKQAKWKADSEVHVTQIKHDIRDKVFDAPLSSFHWKDKYISLAGALSISQDGTVKEFKMRIKNYIADPTHAADIAQNPHFSGLFLDEKKRVAEKARKKVEEEARKRAEEKARKKAEEERKKQRQSEAADKQRKTTGKMMIHPMDPDPGTSMAM
ncbi:hypothetical protein PAXINDRAFT_8206 [Paxillus involutus ATCC 200175]|nr:hypothetical protein PAXINDRAFT_8206 [Paxillus involutus ATCC 200175]